MINPDKLNGSGCKDLTAYEAIRNVESEDRFNKLLKTIFNICDLAGFHVEERIVLKDKKTGKVWR
jgi:hypothetical protein